MLIESEKVPLERVVIRTKFQGDDSKNSVLTTSQSESSYGYKKTGLIFEKGTRTAKVSYCPKETTTAAFQLCTSQSRGS